MDKDESIALWRRGRRAWNDWANGMLADRKRLEEAGVWRTVARGGEINPGNPQTKVWMIAATVDFSDMRFMADEFAELQSSPDQKANTLIIKGDVIDFGGFIFPWDARFAHARFFGSAWFRGAHFHGEACFLGAQFHETAENQSAGFEKAQFDGTARFRNAQFHATAWFSRTTFKAAEFENAEFYRLAWFGEARFHGEAGFRNTRFRATAESESAGFKNSHFYAEARFGGAQFYGLAWFQSSQFYRSAWFKDAQFGGTTEFRGAQFYGLAQFDGAQFKETAEFQSAQFRGQTESEGADFWGARFDGVAGFGGARFEVRPAFANATFKASTTFRGTEFGDKKQKKFVCADFTGIKAERAFDLRNATFSLVPAFNQASFEEAPDLDDVTYPPPPFFRFWISGWKKAELKADAARYRHLRRLAILGHDHENESKAFKGETRAKRGTEHRPYHASYWFGLGYDAFSDFGRSMTRPLYVWAVLTALFGLFYFVNSDALTLWACSVKAERIPAHIVAWVEAAYLAIKNGLIFVGLGSETRIGQAHACLYGGNIQEPVFPSRISVLQLAQNLVSAPLIFLFLLGVRNQFKIK
jgi:hypothetical protein